MKRPVPHFLKLCPIFVGSVRLIYLFHKKNFTKLLKVSCTFQCNHQATGLKKYEFTTIVLKTTNPYLLICNLITKVS